MNVKKGVVLALVCGLVGLGTTASYAAQAAQTPPESFLVLLGLDPGYDKSLSIQQQKTFPAHAAYMNELEGKGKLVFGGPLLESFASMQPTGAVLVVRADAAEEARQIAAGDPSGLLAVQEVRALLLAVAPRP